MELTRELSSEQLPQSHTGSMASLIHSQSKMSATGAPQGTGANNPLTENMSEEELTSKVENILLERIREGNKVALFQLGQLYYEQGDYTKARTYFERADEKGDFQAMFQLGVILYDGLTGTPEHEQAVEYMLKVAQAKAAKARHLLRAAQYNVGRAYFQGYGIKQSDAEAERWWLMAADDGNPKASIKAQCMLGMFYCRDDTRDLKKAFFWHSEACGNDSLESQGALGVMHMYGLGTKKNVDSAFICLREAAERDNVYAMGNLVAYYYRRKLYTKTIDLAARVSQFESPEQIGAETDCLPSYIAKGISMACFYYARCLHLGHGVKPDEDEAKKYYSRSYEFDPDVCAQLQNITQHGEI